MATQQPTKVCPQCGLTFTRTRTMTRWESRIFCTRACRGASHRLRPPVSSCTVCGTEFPSRSGAHALNRFCSVSCARRSRPVTRPDATGRGRARALYPEGQPCEVCGHPFDGRRGSARHHVSGDRMDNRAENIQWLCKRHHADAHRVLDGATGGGLRPISIGRQRAAAAERGRLAREMIDSGMTTAEVASAMGVHPVSVFRWFRKYRV